MYKIVELKTIANVTTGFPFKGEQYSNVGIKVLRGENVTIGALRWDSIKCWDKEFEHFEKYSLQEGDVVIGMDGSRVGKNRARITKEDLPMLLAQRVACLRSNEYSSQDFLYYLIKDDKFENFVNRVQTGSSIPHISLSQIENFPVAFPSLETQQKIASVLSSLDSKIELNNRINAELEAMAKTLYDYWFVQFDFPDANGQPYKLSGGAMVWNEELKREIPEGWEVKKIGEVATIKAGGDKPEIFSLEQNGNCSIPIYSNGVTNSGLYGFTNKATITKQCITISARGTIGYSVLRSKPFVPIIRLIVVTPNLDGVAKYFHEYIKGIAFENSGSVQQQLTVPHVSSLNILCPNVDVLKSFGNFTNPLVEKIEVLNLENQKLSELRDWLLPMLMNGQVRVK